jgi:hypothetical protein
MNIAKELRELADKVEGVSTTGWACVERGQNEKGSTVLALRHPGDYYYFYVVEGAGYDERRRLRRLAEFLNDKGWK